jgi:hypothetical protein
MFEMCCSAAAVGLVCGIRTRVIDAASRVLGGSCAAFRSSARIRRGHLFSDTFDST